MEAVASFDGIQISAFASGTATGEFRDGHVRLDHPVYGGTASLHPRELQVYPDAGMATLHTRVGSCDIEFDLVAVDQLQARLIKGAPLVLAIEVRRGGVAGHAKVCGEDLGRVSGGEIASAAAVGLG